MDTTKMVTELKIACATLEKEKEVITKRLGEIDAELTAYRNAINSLAPTVTTEQMTTKAPNGKFSTVYTYNGVSHTLPVWSKQLGIGIRTLRARINAGWAIEDVFSKPVGNTGPNKKHRKPLANAKVFAYDKNGNVIRQYVGVQDASRDLNLPATTIQKIIENMDKEDQLRVRNYYLKYV